MFERPHHQRIAQVLLALDGPLLRAHQCMFGGGTAIALRRGEFRESVDLDFLVSDVSCYRDLRQLLTGPEGFAVIIRKEAQPLIQMRQVRADQYGIRTSLSVAETNIKFEIVLEGRFDLEAPGEDDEICGIATLTPLDMATSKLLANSDRWADDGVFSRDLIDLAMLNPPLVLFRQAMVKAGQAYGEAVRDHLAKAITGLETRPDRLQRCVQALAINLPKALVWEKIRALRRMLPRTAV